MSLCPDPLTSAHSPSYCSSSVLQRQPYLCHLFYVWIYLGLHLLQANGWNRKYPDYSISTGDCIIVSFAETQNVSFPSMCSEVGGPTGNILCSLRFWAHFQWGLWEGSDQVSKCPSSLLTDSSCVRHCLYVTLTFAFALSHKQTMYSWASRLPWNSSVIQDAATHACFDEVKVQSGNLELNCLLFLSSEKQTKVHVKMKRRCCWCIHWNTQFKYFLEKMDHKQLSS